MTRYRIRYPSGRYVGSNAQRTTVDGAIQFEFAAQAHLFAAAVGLAQYEVEPVGDDDDAGQPSAPEPRPAL